MGFLGHFYPSFYVVFQAFTHSFLRGENPNAAGESKSAGANTLNYCLPTLI
jgi:hypothetical protein